MKLRTFTAWLLIVIVSLTGATAHAHPGGTDGQGHTDRSTGEYHYHHGYPAHQHTNGVCPYGFDDKTGESSGSSGGSTRIKPYAAVASQGNELLANLRADPTEQPDPEIKNDARSAGVINLTLAVTALTLAVILLWTFGRISSLKAEVKKAAADINSLKKSLEQEKSSASDLKAELVVAEGKLFSQKSLLLQASNIAEEAACIVKDYINGKRLYKETDATDIRFSVLNTAYDIARAQETLPQFYANHSLRELSNMPDDTVIGRDVLPKQRNCTDWGAKYTRYISSDIGKCYHKKTCQFAYRPQHVVRLRTLLPCSLCYPEPLPDVSWYDKYMNHRQECLKLNITPKPNDGYFIAPRASAEISVVKYSIKTETGIDYLDF